MLADVMDSQLHQENILNEPQTRLHPLLHWLRRFLKLAAAIVLIPPVLLGVFIFFSAWRAIAKWRE
ncbi:MAG: hypothetical protein DRH70_01905 [Candidatus Coatesbacteria bacterium]|nr:MAG: hypothetical protein DRH70_01905 [Candidatus Coatesbacteria bacterium]